MRGDNEEEEERMEIWAGVAKILVHLVARLHVNLEVKHQLLEVGVKRESGSAGVRQVGRGGRWRSDACQQGQGGALPPALREPRHQGRSDKRSVNN